MQINKFSTMLLSVVSCVALLNGCGSSSKEGTSGGSGSSGGVALVSEGTCIACHSTTIDPIAGTGIVSDYATSAHNLSDGGPGCQGCHGGGAEHNGIGPLPFPDPLQSARCQTCHTDTINGVAVNKVPAAAVQGLDFNGKCAHCHTTGGTGGIHAATTTDKSPNGSDDCIGCHAVAAPQHGSNLVGDNPDSAGNPGVRAVVGEFSKWSHHVTGVNVQNAHCATCHLEGTVSLTTGKIVVDTTKHMVDNFVHLRNVDNDSDMQWDPAKPNLTTMDTFCMSCHDANGATSPMTASIRSMMVPAAGKTASATNPFGDTISNRYDKMQRPAVTDVSSQFNTTNNSHHGVKGPRYSGNSRFSGTNPVDGNVRRTIASPATFALNSTAILQGVRRTIYDAGNFNQLYIPLQNTGGEAAPRTGAKNLGDDSTLHCGDCHTVGQWKPGVVTNAAGQLNTVAIGAHGSTNEYLLRNNIGTDERHTQNAFTVSGTTVTYTNPNGAFLVCYNCHNYNNYGKVVLATGVLGGHVGEYDETGRCNGTGNTLPFNGYTTGKATDGTQFISRFKGPIAVFSSPAPYPGEQDPDFANIYGIQCLNCHNSGVGNAYGGIHGSARNTSWNNGTAVIQPNASITGGAYIDGMGNTTKNERFLPGLGNVMFVPGTLGGITGGTAAGPVTNTDTRAVNSAGALSVTYTYTTGGISNDANWEQRHWEQEPGTVIDNVTGAVTGNWSRAGAGCYTLGTTAATNGSLSLTTDVSTGLTAPSVTGPGGPGTAVYNTWGGCNDHAAGQALGNHGFVRKIVRPVTY